MTRQAVVSRSKSKAAPAHSPGRIFVGTASWADPGFIADWYPPGLAAARRLPYYAEHFSLVELNSSFYGVPAPSLVERWCRDTPDGFVFDVKLHRLLSRHSTQLNQLPRALRPRTTVSDKVTLTPQLESALAKHFLEAVEPLSKASKLGALLLQLSPSFSPKKHSLDELDHLLEILKGHKLAVELRNRHWVTGAQLDATVGFFKKRRVALVDVDAPASEHFMVMPELDVVTTPKLAYLRLHGRNARGYISGRSVAERFDYKYSEKELQSIAGRVESLADLAVEVHVIFNNNKSNYAPVAAERFQEIMADRIPEAVAFQGE